MIPTKKSPYGELATPEHCCFCRSLTRWWTALKDRTPGQQVACCKTCAVVKIPTQVPTKDEWWDKEEEIMRKRRRAAGFE